MVGRAVSVCSGFGSWCFSRLDAQLVLVVCRWLRCRTAGVVGCWLSVVFAWPGRTGRPPERMWCATPLSWSGRTGRPLERVRCATPSFCFAGVVALPPMFPYSPSAFVCLRGFLAVRWCLSPPAAAPPRLHPPHPSACCLPPPSLLLGVAAPAGGWSPPPPTRGLALRGRWRVDPHFFLLPLCLVVALSRLAVCRGLLLAAPTPGFVFREYRCPAARFPVSSCCLLVFSVPLALAPVWSGCFFPLLLAAFRALRALLAGAAHPPGGCPCWCVVPCVLSCGAAVGCGLFCSVRGVFLRRAVLVCGCLAVWCAVLLCCWLRRWLSPVGVGHAVSLGVARCSAAPCCVVQCFVVCGAVVRCCVLWYLLWCCVVSWPSPCCLSAFLVLRTCKFAPPGAAPPPPGLCVVPCAGWCCRAVLACSVLRCGVLCCQGCGLPFRVVPCLSVLRG